MCSSDLLCQRVQRGAFAERGAQSFGLGEGQRVVARAVHQHHRAAHRRGGVVDGERVVGSPMQAVQVYNLRNVDELCFFDIAATREGRGPDFALVDELADRCFMPLTVGGGVRTVEDVRGLLSVGADKVAVNSVVFEQPSMLQIGRAHV